jgi:hypothetical protein
MKGVSHMGGRTIKTLGKWQSLLSSETIRRGDRISVLFLDKEIYAEGILGQVNDRVGIIGQNLLDNPPLAWKSIKKVIVHFVD